MLLVGQKLATHLGTDIMPYNYNDIACSHVVLRPPYENDILDCSAYYDGIIDIKKIVASAVSIMHNVV